MRAISRIALLLTVLPLLGGGALAAAVRYDLPEETAELLPGPHRDVAQANCGACHSADYIGTQPRTFRDPRAFWTAEVVKMQKAYGAPIAEDDAKLIVEYLVAAYGR